MCVGIAGPRRDNNNDRMSRRLTWCSEKLKRLIDIEADELISQMLDTQK